MSEPLTAEELAELLDGAENAELFEVSRAEFARTLRDALALIATLTTRADQAEARIGDAVRVITQLQQRAQLAEARVAELEAVLESIVAIGRLENYAALLASGERIEFSEELREAARAAMEGQR